MINTTLPIESVSPRKADGDGLCVICKGAKRLCGKDRCPLMIKFYSRQKTAPMIDFKDLGGSCPPAVFVGRYGYPKVDIGPLLPPFHGDTSVMDRPEEWVGKTIDEITDMRFSLVRGKYRIDATDFAKAGRIVEQIQEILAAQRKKYWDASHVVYAYILKDGAMRFSFTLTDACEQVAFAMDVPESRLIRRLPSDTCTT